MRMYQRKDSINRLFHDESLECRNQFWNHLIKIHDVHQAYRKYFSPDVQTQLLA